jgi:YfiR/HmsC-like
LTREPNKRIASLILYVLGSWANVTYAQARVDEYRLKAAFILHFAELADWPAGTLDSQKGPVVFCTLGGNPFEGELEAAVADKQIGTHPILVRHLRQWQDSPGCHVLFLGAGEHARTAAHLAKLKDAPVLTVGEGEDFVKQGGIIGLCLEGKKVRFDINLEAARRAGLKISSRLLVLARNVVGGRN